MRRNQKRKEPSQERSKETVDTILQAVVALIEEGKTEALTTTRIAERAGVGIGSVYQFFPGKEAIFSSLIQWYLKKELNQVCSALGQIAEHGLEPAVSSMVDNLIRTRRKNLAVERALIRFFATAGDAAFLAQFDLELIARVDEALKGASERGLSYLRP